MRSVLVTGGAKRIGETICNVLRARGWNVLVHSRDVSHPLGVDLAADGAADRLFAQACAAAPDFCAIVNNAAEFATARNLAAADAARLMRVNAEVPMRLAELLAQRLKARGETEGAVVNLLDVRILRALAVPTPYEASKQTLAAATCEQARALAPWVRVNGVAPGPVLVPTDAANREKGGAVLLARRPTPRDVADAVAFLLEAASVTGQILAVDAGQSFIR